MSAPKKKKEGKAQIQSNPKPSKDEQKRRWSRWQQTNKQKNLQSQKKLETEPQTNRFWGKQVKTRPDI